jgi:hypothetical protein
MANAAKPGPHMKVAVLSGAGMAQACQLAECMSRHQKNGQEIAHAKR